MRLLVSSIAALLAAGAVYSASSTVLGPGALLEQLQSSSTDNAYIRADVTPLSPKVTGFVAEVAVRDNQQVRKGQVLYRIEDNDFRARVHQARASLESKRASIANLNSRLDAQRASVQQAKAIVDGSKADADRAARDFSRSSALLRSGATSEANLDTTRSANLSAISKVTQAEANLAAAQAQMEVIESQRPQLVADIEAALASLQLAEIELDNTVIRAPADGTVGERQAKHGQLVRPGTSLIPFVTAGTWVIANFKETQIAAMQIGDRVEVRVDALPKAIFFGRVDSFSPASAAQFALLPPDNATGNFTRIVQRIPVKVIFDEAQSGLERLQSGMSARVAVVVQ